MEAGIPTGLSRAEGRRFGATVGGAFLLCAALVHFRRHNDTGATVLLAIGTLLLMASIVAPARLGPLHRRWMALAHLMSKVTTPIFMGVVFFGIMMPIGLLMRVFGRRVLVRRPQDGSYWVAPASGGRSDMTRHF